MFENLKNNLSKNQKIAILIFLQLIIIIIIAWLFSTPVPEIKQEIQTSGNLETIPSTEQQNYSMQVYNLLAKAYPNAPIEQSKVIIRDNSYTETEEGAVTTANFLVDVDEYKQTYQVSISWSKTQIIPNGVSVDCPKKQDMKYKETYCQGRYYNTDSIELYVPYEAKENGHTIYTLSTNDENPFLIDVVIATCDDAEFNRIKTIAENYLTSSGINFSVYSYAFRQICLKN